MSIDSEEENWYNPLHELELKAIHKGVVVYSPWIEMEVGKIGKGIRFDERDGFDYQNPTKRIWGVKFIKRFNEPFVWKMEGGAASANPP